jgi:hypothetical protein
MLKKLQVLLFFFIVIINNCLFSNDQNNILSEAKTENIEKKQNIVDNCFDFVVQYSTKIFDSCKKYAKIGLAKTIITSQEVLRSVVGYLKSGKEIVSKKLENTVSWAKEIEKQNKKE